MLEELGASNLRHLFSLQMKSTNLSYSKESLSLKQKGQFSYICVKTQPLKFSILLFENNCLTNVRSFTLKTNNKQITFLNLEVQNTQLQKQTFQIFVGYQTREYDIYNIIGDNAKLIQSSKQTKITKHDFVNVFYHHNLNQILIVNRNVLTSIQIEYPFRLKRQQQIQPILCSQMMTENTLVTGGHNINFFQLANFNKIRTINISCSALKANFLNGGYYLGNSKDQFQWISQQGQLMYQFDGFKSFIRGIFTQDQLVYVFSNVGQMACIESKLLKKSRISSEIEQEQKSQYQGKNDSIKQFNDSNSNNFNINIRQINNEAQQNKNIHTINSPINGLKSSKVASEDQFQIQSNKKNKSYATFKYPQFSRLTKLTNLNINEGIQAVYMLNGLIVLINSKGQLSISQIVRPVLK